METTNQNQESIVANKRIMDDLLKIQDIRAQARELKESEDNIKKHLAKLIHDVPVIVDKDGEKVASWAEIEFNRLDQEALKESYPDIYQSFVRKSFEKRLQIYLKRRQQQI
jgi:predicted metal-dependent hydrolase